MVDIVVVPHVEVPVEVPPHVSVPEEHAPAPVIVPHSTVVVPHSNTGGPSGDPHWSSGDTWILLAIIAAFVVLSWLAVSWANRPRR